MLRRSGPDVKPVGGGEQDDGGTVALGCPHTACNCFSRNRACPSGGAGPRILISAFPFLSAERGVAPAVFPATAAAAGSAFAAIAQFVAGAAARPAAFCFHPHAVWRVADVLVPAAAEVFAALCPAVNTTFPAVAGIFGLAWGSPYLEEKGA